jgi:hypothetical protein
MVPAAKSASGHGQDDSSLTQNEWMLSQRIERAPSRRQRADVLGPVQAQISSSASPTSWPLAASHYCDMLARSPARGDYGAVKVMALEVFQCGLSY